MRQWEFDKRDLGLSSRRFLWSDWSLQQTALHTGSYEDMDGNKDRERGGDR